MLPDYQGWGGVGLQCNQTAKDRVGLQCNLAVRGGVGLTQKTYRQSHLHPPMQIIIT